MDMEGWEALRRQARQLENALDIKLVSYSKFSANFAQSRLLDGNQGGGGLGDEAAGAGNDHASLAMSMEIDMLLRQLQEVNDALSARLEGVDRVSHGSMHHAAQHHRGRLQDCVGDYRRIRASIQEAQEHAQLLSTVRRDISDYKSGSRQDHLLRERGHIKGSEALLDDVLGQAQEAHSVLGRQSAFLNTTVAKLRQVGNQLPGVSVLLTRIRRKKTRDSMILASFIGLLTCFLLWYWLST